MYVYNIYVDIYIYIYVHTCIHPCMYTHAGADEARAPVVKARLRLRTALCAAQHRRLGREPPATPAYTHIYLCVSMEI